MRKDELNDQKQIIEIAVDIYLTGTECKKSLTVQQKKFLLIYLKSLKKLARII